MGSHARVLVGLIKEQLGDHPNFPGCEVGVWRGSLSAHLLRALPELHLLMVDKYQPYNDHRLGINTQEDMHQTMLEAIQATQFAADRRTFMLASSTTAATYIKDFSLSFVFIDGAHDYDSVTKDIGIWIPKVKLGGIISGHDYNGRGDRRGLFGVKRAVDDYFDDPVNVLPGLVWWVRK